MKKISFLILAVVILIGFQSESAATTSGPVSARQVKKSVPTEVYYFHMTRRCVTCQAVETVTEEALKENFADAMSKGEVTFKSVNLEDKENKGLVKKMKVSGQSLLVVNGPERIDITDKGFMYAKTDPDKLKAEVKATISKFIK